MVKQLREAMSEASDGDVVNVNIFVGTDDNAEKLNEVVDLVEYLQDNHPTFVIETFVAAIPPDIQAAELLRRNMTEQMNARFKAAFPRQEMLN